MNDMGYKEIKEATQVKKNKKTTMYELSFVFKKKVKYGCGLYLVGSVPELGLWNTSMAVKMFWQKGDNWSQTVLLKLPQGVTTVIEYKFIISCFNRIDSKNCVWESGPNRMVQIKIQDSIKKNTDSNISVSTDSKVGDKSDTEKTRISNFFKKKNSPEIATLSSEKPRYYKINFKNKSESEIEKVIQSKLHSSIDFLLVKNAPPSVVKTLIPLLLDLMVYYDDNDEDRNTHAVFYNFTKWNFEESFPVHTICSEPGMNQWAIFSKKDETKSKAVIDISIHSLTETAQVLIIDSIFLKRMNNEKMRSLYEQISESESENSTKYILN